MAFSYPNTPVLSKARIGDDYYYLKDADLRAVVDGFTADIVNGSIGAMTENNKFVYSQNIKEYVDAAVRVGLVIVVVADISKVTASAETMGKLYLEGPKSDGLVEGDYYDEYVTLRNGTEGSYTYSWEKIGSTRIDLSGYLTEVAWDASGRKLTKTKGGTTSDVHAFGSFADASAGTAKLNTVDSAKVSLTPAGQVAVTLKDAATTTAINSAGKFTPAGDITINSYTPAGSINGALTYTETAATLTPGDYTPAGTITLNEGTAYQFNAITAVGTLPTKAADSFTAATYTPTEGDYNTDAMKLRVGKSGDDLETLIIEDAATAKAVASAAFNGGSFVEGAFSQGTLPSMAQQTIQKLDSATFNGTTAEDILVTGVTYSKADKGTLSFAGTAHTLTGSFAGTEGDLAVSGSYKKQEINTATFTGTPIVDQAISLTQTEKTISVSPVLT